MDPNRLISIVLFLFLIASAVTWTKAFARLRSGQAILPYQPRRPVPWGLIDLLALFVLMLSVQIAVAYVLKTTFNMNAEEKLLELEPSQLIVRMSAELLSSVAIVVLSLVLIILRTRATWSDVGLKFSKLGEDVRIGVLAFLMLAPPVYATQWVLTQWFPSSHPFIELLKENPVGKLFLIVGISAVVVAPIAEEYIFRLLLQGWLEKIALHHGNLAALLLGSVGEKKEPEPPDEHLANASSIDKDVDLQQEASAKVCPIWPVVISAALFAGMHIVHGPDPIPLFMLALGLGYLYRQTHRIVPAIVVHALLNGCSTFLLWIAITFDLQ